MSLTAKRLHDHERSTSRRVSSPETGSVSPSQRSLNASFNVHSPNNFNLETSSLDGGRASSVDSRRARSAVSAATSTAAGSAAVNVENVKVVCRVRPFAKREYEIQEEMNASIKDEWDKRPLRSVIDMRDNVTIFLDHEKDFAERQRFEFDISLWSIPPEQQEGSSKFATQSDVMDAVGRPALNHVWNGFNTCLFAYGQTGSGKTHTMMGSKEDPGLIPRMCQELFTSLQRRREEEKGVVVDNTVKEYSLEARFLEIYNERVKDLLWELRPPSDQTETIDKDNLKVRNFGKEGPVVVGLTTVKVESWEDCLALIEEGTRHRSVAATKMNETSSRSHSIFRLNFVQTTKLLPTKQFEKPKTFDRVSNVSLVDLAGSERNKKTGAEGARLKEAVAINLSLTTLKNVIDALVEGRAVVPYRDSQLTWLLSESLGGNSKTFMISCVSPHWDNAEETLNTLRYAMRAQSIVCHASVNESDEMKRMNRMRAELEEMQKRIKENPDEDHMRREYQEQLQQLNALRTEAMRNEQEAKALQEHMERTKEMQFNAAYTHAFKITFLRRLAQFYNETNVQMEQSLLVKSKETQLLRDLVVRKEQDVETVQIEEEVTRKRRAKADDALEQLKDKCQQLETQKRHLLVAEDQKRVAIESKTQLKKNATDVVRVLLARELHVAQKAFDAAVLRDRQRLNQVSENEELRKADEKAKHEARMDEMRHTIAQLREKVAKAQQHQQMTYDKRTKRITKLHSEAIFFENENKSCFQELEDGLSQVNQAGSSKFYKDREELQLKLLKLQTERQEADAHRHKHSRVRDTDTRSEIKHEIMTVVGEGERATEQLLAQFEAQRRQIEQDFARRIALMDTLNEESAQFLHKTDSDRAHYADMCATLVQMVERSATVANASDARALAQQFRNAATKYSSNLPTKFVPTPESVQSTPRSTPRGLRPTMSDLTAGRSPAPTPPATSMASSPRPGTAPTPRREVHVASLQQPKKYVAQPTKTSLLRLAAQNFKRKADTATDALQFAPAAQPTPHVHPNVPALVLRSVSPARSTSATPRDAEIVPRKVAIGNTYIVSRSRSPRSVVRSVTPPRPDTSGGDSQVQQRAFSTTSPRRHGY